MSTSDDKIAIEISQNMATAMQLTDIYTVQQQLDPYLTVVLTQLTLCQLAYTTVAYRYQTCHH